MLRRLTLPALEELAVVGLLVLSILWKGGKTLEMTLLLVVVAWAVTLLSFVRTRDNPEIRHVPRALFWAAIGFIVWTMGSYVTSTAKNYGLDEIFRDGSFVLLFLWTIRHSDPHEKPITFREKFVITVAIATIAACALGVAVYALQPVNRFVGSFFDFRFHTDYWPNSWAQFLLLAWPLTLLWAKNFRAPVRELLVGFVLGSLLLSYSRSALIAFGGQLVILGILLLCGGAGASFAQKAASSARRYVLSAVLIAAVAAAMFFGVNALRMRNYPVESVVAKATFTSAEGATSVDERKAFWHQAWVLSWERPLLGWGPYSFRFIQPRIQEDIYATSDHAHNVFLKYGMERGWPAAFFFGFLLLCILVKGFATSLRNSMEEGSAAFVMVAVTSVAGVLAHNLIDFDLQFVGIALPFWILLGLLTRSVFRKQERSKSYTKIVRSAEVLLATVLMVAAVFEGSYLVLSMLGRKAEAEGRIDDAISWYTEARGEWFSRDMHLSRTQLLIEEGRNAEAASALNDYFAQNADDARAWKMKGDLAVHAQKVDDALVAYSIAWEYGKFNYTSILYGYIEALERKGGRAAVLQERPEIDATILAYADAIQRDTHFIALSPSVEGLLAVIEKMSQIFPADAPRYDVLSAEIDRNAKEERQRLESTHSGILW